MQADPDHKKFVKHKGVHDLVLLVRPTERQMEHEIKKKMTKTWKTEDKFVKFKSVAYSDLNVVEWCKPTNLRYFTSEPFALPAAPRIYCKSRILIKNAFHYHVNKRSNRILIFNGPTAERCKHINFTWRDFIIFYECGKTFIFHNEKPINNEMCSDCQAFNVNNKYSCFCYSFDGDIKQYWEHQGLSEPEMRKHCELISETTLPYMEWESFIIVEDTCYAHQYCTEKITQKILSLYPNIKDIVFVSGCLRFT